MKVVGEDCDAEYRFRGLDGNMFPHERMRRKKSRRERIKKVDLKRKS